MRKQWGKDWNQGEEKNRAEKEVKGKGVLSDGVTDKGRKEEGRENQPGMRKMVRGERKGKGTR